MCLLTSGQCPYCRFLKPITTKNCQNFWFEYKESVKNNDLANKPVAEDCDRACFEAIEIRPGRCPRLPNCPSLIVWKKIQKMKAARAEEERHMKVIVDEKVCQQKEEFVKKYFQKIPIQQQAAPVNFIEACRMDSIARVEKTRQAVQHAEEKFKKAMEFAKLSIDNVFSAGVFDSDSEDEVDGPAGPANKTESKGKGKAREPASKMFLLSEMRRGRHTREEQEQLAGIDMENLQEILASLSDCHSGSVSDSPILCRLAEEPYEKNDEDVFGIADEGGNLDGAESFITIDDDKEIDEDDYEEHLLDYVQEEYLPNTTNSNFIPPASLSSASVIRRPQKPSDHHTYRGIERSMSTIPEVPEGGASHSPEGNDPSDVSEPESISHSVVHRMRYNLGIQLTNGLVKVASYVHPPKFLGRLFTQNVTQVEPNSFIQASDPVYDTQNVVEMQNGRFTPL